MSEYVGRKADQNERFARLRKEFSFFSLTPFCPRLLIHPSNLYVFLLSSSYFIVCEWFYSKNEYCVTFNDTNEGAIYTFILLTILGAFTTSSIIALKVSTWGRMLVYWPFRWCYLTYFGLQMPHKWKSYQQIRTLDDYYDEFKAFIEAYEAPADRIRRQEWAAKVLSPFFNATKEEVETFKRFELLLMNLYRRYKIPISKRHQFDCVYNFNRIRSQEKYQKIISEFYEEYSDEIAEFYSVSGKNRSVNLNKIVNYYLSSESLPSKRVNSCFIPHPKKGFFEAFGDVIHNISQSLNYFRGKFSRYQRLEVKEEKDLYTMYMDRGVESLELLVFILYQSKNISLSSRPKAVHVSSFKLVLSDLFTLCFDGFICFTYCRAYIIIVNSAATEMDLLKFIFTFCFSLNFDLTLREFFTEFLISPLKRKPDLVAFLLDRANDRFANDVSRLLIFLFLFCFIVVYTYSIFEVKCPHK